MSHLEDSPTKTEQAIDIRFDLRTALYSIDEQARAYEYLLQVQALAEDAEDRRRLGWVWVFLAQHMRATVDHPRAVELGEQALAIADETGDGGLRILALNVVGQSTHELGHFQRAIDLLKPQVDSLVGTSDYERGRQHVAAASSWRGVLAFCLAWQGNFREASEYVEEALRIAEETNHPQTLDSANSQASLVAALSGDVPLAIRRSERSLAIAAGLGVQPHPSRRAFLGYTYSLAGRAEEAVAQLEQALARAEVIRHFACSSLWTEWLAGAYLLAGRRTDAERTAERALKLARDYREHGFEGYALRQLGDVLAADKLPDVARTEDLYMQALAIAEALEMRPLQAHTHLSLGKLYRRTGRVDEARAELNVAIDLYFTLEMAQRLPEAEAELTATASPSAETVG